MAATGPGSSFPVNQINMIIRGDVTTHYSARLQLGMYSYWGRVSAVGGTGCVLGDIATTLNGMFATLTKTVLSAAVSFRGIQARMVHPLPASPPAYEKASVGAGSVLGDALPTQTAGVIGIYTRYAGRAFRGRRYVPFPGEADNGVDGLPLAAYVTSLQAIADNLATAFTTAGPNNVTITPILFHRGSGTYTDVVSATARPLWGNQRRRGAYGRTNSQPF